jgi:hypothetical protein
VAAPPFPAALFLSKMESACSATGSCSIVFPLFLFRKPKLNQVKTRKERCLKRNCVLQGSQYLARGHLFRFFGAARQRHCSARSGGGGLGGDEAAAPGGG